MATMNGCVILYHANTSCHRRDISGCTHMNLSLPFIRSRLKSDTDPTDCTEIQKYVIVTLVLQHMSPDSHGSSCKTFSRTTYYQGAHAFFSVMNTLMEWKLEKLSLTQLPNRLGKKELFSVRVNCLHGISKDRKMYLFFFHFPLLTFNSTLF